MYSKFNISVQRTADNLKQYLLSNPVVIDEGILNQFQLKAVGIKENPKFWLICTTIRFPLHPFARVEIVETSNESCEIRGILWIGPVFIIFLTFAYGFMLSETVKNYIANVGTDKLALAMILTLFAFAWFVFIPKFVVGRWRRAMEKKIAENLRPSVFD